MRFFIDNALPPRVAKLILAMGHDAVQVLSYGMQESSDIEVLQRAREEHRIIVSGHSDFRVILGSQATWYPSFILFRKPNLLQAQDYIDLPAPVLETLEPRTRERMRGGLPRRTTPSSQAAFLGLETATRTSHPQFLSTANPALHTFRKYRQPAEQ